MDPGFDATLPENDSSAQVPPVAGAMEVMVVIGAIQRVLVVGSGTMGMEIGFQCALYGCDVYLSDADPAALATLGDRARAYGQEIVGAGFLEAAGLAAALARMTPVSSTLEAAAGADLVVECVPEDPVLKGRVFAELNDACPPRTIFATNTSSLLPSMFAAATGRPARLAAFHFHLPVWRSNVVDVMPHAGTDADVIETLVAFAKRIGQVPIRVARESHGYVFNAMYNAVNREAMTLVANGIASVEDVDRAWMGIFKMPIGPFGMLDDVGLDTVWHITDFWARTLGDDQLRRNANMLRGYTDRGRLGRKSGAGFYDYPEPAYARPGFVSGE
jgi:3-hydroxybutyryl-CoA dehydrogenase